MWGINLHPMMQRMLVIVVAFLSVNIPIAVFAQTISVVTDADIERAKKLQPNISEKDIERAQQRYRMPSDAELSQVPIPQAPNIDALPTPISKGSVDIGAIANSYESNSSAMNSAQGIQTGPSLLVFVSFSMPEVTLNMLIGQAARTRATLVIRGLVNGSLVETVGRVHRLIGKRRVAFLIDPKSFDKFAVVSAPTFVLLRDGAQTKPCDSGLCYATDSYISVAGDVSLDYALEYIVRSSPRFTKDARRFLGN